MKLKYGRDILKTLSHSLKYLMRQGGMLQMPVPIIIIIIIIIMLLLRLLLTLKKNLFATYKIKLYMQLKI